MLRWTSRILLIVIVLATGWFVIDRKVLEPRERARVREEAGEVALSVMWDVANFNFQTFERGPFPGEPATGDALDHYREALRLMETSGVERELLYHVDVGDAAAPAVFAALAPAFAALERGTRAAEVGVFLPVLGVGEETNLGPMTRLAELLSFAAALDFEFGRAAEGLARVETALRVGRDLTMARPWDVSRRTLCEQPIEVLGRGVATRKLGAAERTRAIEILRANLSSLPPVWEALHVPCLSIQVLLVAYFRDEVTYERLRADLLLPPRTSRWFGLVREGPTDRELLSGWRRLREFMVEFEAEAAERPAMFATWATNRVREYSATKPPLGEFAVVTPGLVWGTVALWGKGKRTAEEQAVLIALRLLDAEARTGAFPTDLEGMIDPEAVPRLPGGKWALRDSDLGKPALFHEFEGTTTLAQASRLVPVFQFR